MTDGRRLGIAVGAALLLHCTLLGQWYSAQTSAPQLSQIRKKMNISLSYRRPEPAVAQKPVEPSVKPKQENTVPVVTPVAVKERQPLPARKKKVEPVVEQVPVVAPSKRVETKPVEPVREQVTDNAPITEEAKVKLATPLYRKNPPPIYPRRARKRGVTGTVLLLVSVSGIGRVQDIKIEKTSGHSILDKAAVKSVQKWLFEPGLSDGKPASMWVQVPVRFELR